MTLTKDGRICTGCGTLLARANRGGQTMRPKWPGYEVQERAPDGRLYLVMKCAECDGPPPLTWGQSLILMPQYVGGVALLVAALAAAVMPRVQEGMAVVSGLAGLILLAHARRQRSWWRIGGDRR